MKQAGNWNTAFLEKKDVNRTAEKVRIFLVKSQINQNPLLKMSFLGQPSY